MLGARHHSTNTELAASSSNDSNPYEASGISKDGGMMIQLKLNRSCGTAVKPSGTRRPRFHPMQMSSSDGTFKTEASTYLRNQHRNGTTSLRPSSFQEVAPQGGMGAI